jgi:hypothetical protein
MDRVTRRRFLGAGLDAAALAALAGTLAPLSALAAGNGATAVLFDPRFPAARAAALQLAGGGVLMPVPGDPMVVLEACLRCSPGAGVPRVSGLRIAGVTTESVPFCLEQLFPRYQRPILTLERIDQDLFSWRLESRA